MLTYIPRYLDKAIADDYVDRKGILVSTAGKFAARLI